MHPYLRHLRLPFNLLLSPIYLWGVLLAGGSLRDLTFWAGYVALHLFLYGGTTAFNSFYDRDEGPVGGMADPPPVDEGLLGFALMWQALGVPLAWWVGGSFLLAWALLCFVLGAYSHPAIRFKANTWAALAAVAFGQGAIGFAAGWLGVQPALGSLLGAVPLLGMASTALIVSGLYIVTQSYQTHEDRARGDRTLPVRLGAGRALLVALALLAVGGSTLVLGLGQRFGWGWGLALTLFFAAVGAALLRWALRFDEAQVMENFRTAMQVAALSAGGLSLFLIYHLF